MESVIRQDRKLYHQFKKEAFELFFFGVKKVVYFSHGQVLVTRCTSPVPILSSFRKLINDKHISFHTRAPQKEDFDETRP